MSSMRLRTECKVFHVLSGPALEKDFNAWHQAMRDNVHGFVIVQSHLIQVRDGPMLVVFWTAPEVVPSQGAVS